MNAQVNTWVLHCNRRKLLLKDTILKLSKSGKLGCVVWQSLHSLFCVVSCEEMKKIEERKLTPEEIALIKAQWKAENEAKKEARKEEQRKQWEEEKLRRKEERDKVRKETPSNVRLVFYLQSSSDLSVSWHVLVLSTATSKASRRKVANQRGNETTKNGRAHKVERRKGSGEKRSTNDEK